MTRTHRRAVATTGAVLLALAGAACTGTTSGGANDDPSKDTTITFWHGWSAPSEVKAIQATITAFEDKYPNIHVKVVGNITDDKINQALRAGGSSAPDVVSSFTTDNVGEFCSSHVFTDLTPFLEKSGVDPKQTFPAALLDYTQFEGNQCTLPLLSDAYGLYYNKDAFQAAGISSPPKTLSEFKQDAIALTKSTGDSYTQLGFMPDFHGYESTIEPLRGTVGADLLQGRRHGERRQRPGAHGDVHLAEGVGGCVGWLRQAGEVPLDVRGRVQLQEPLHDRSGRDGHGWRVASRHDRRRPPRPQLRRGALPGAR